MNDRIHHDALLGVSDVYSKHLAELLERFRFRTTVKILVVIDGGISLTEAPSGFGLGRVVRLLRESNVGCLNFAVDLAVREGAAATVASPAANQPKYTGFRFDQQAGGAPILDSYHEVWCFGFNPGNNNGAPDSDITMSEALPASDSELRVLTKWMNEKQGGLLAMGDHDYLGASMCHRIPRIRSMRRWTNAQGVPPIGGMGLSDTHLRHDTNQPFSAAQLAGTATIPFSVQEDSKPQTIDWVPWLSQRTVFAISTRPHPILCHPKHGPIDVLPDHPHEGWCYEDEEIDLGQTYEFDDYAGDEYPTVSGNQPAPALIAHGWTTPNPPYLLSKGASPKKRFGMIGVYDGHAANVGRVATDSTWHHWFDENITQIEAAGGENWDKISRYYLNVASWLAPPSVPDWCLGATIVASHFTYLGFQEYSKRMSAFDLGVSLRTHLIKRYGPCWVTDWVLDKIRIVDDDFWSWLKERLFWSKNKPAPGGPCLSCPPFEFVESAVLGGLVKVTFPVADSLKKQVAGGSGKPLKLDEGGFVGWQKEGVLLGVKELRGALAASSKEMQARLKL
jgi:hypothetical protein